MFVFFLLQSRQRPEQRHGCIEVGYVDVACSAIYVISHLHANYKYPGRSLFTDSNAYVAVSNVFKSVLRISHLSRAYLIVEGLDDVVKT